MIKPLQYCFDIAKYYWRLWLLTINLSYVTENLEENSCNSNWNHFNFRLLWQIMRKLFFFNFQEKKPAPTVDVFSKDKKVMNNLIKNHILFIVGIDKKMFLKVILLK